MNNTDKYDAPAVERLGKVADLTAAASLVNSDTGSYANTAFSNP
jgi:hypothetical protein